MSETQIEVKQGATATGEANASSAAAATATTTTGTSITQPVVTIIEEKKPLLYFGKKVELGSRKVQIVRIDKFNLIPKTKEAQSIRDEVTLKIGSQWVLGTRDIIRGLSLEEEKKYLPTLLGISASSDKWQERTLTHWADYFIQIPNNTTGITLEVGFHVVTTDGKEEILPINLIDYINYNFAKANGKVAKEDEDNLILFDFKMIDKARKQKEIEDEFATKKSVNGVFNKLINSTDTKDRAKIDWLLETKGGPNGDGMNIIGMTNTQKEMELEKLKEANVFTFEKLLEDRSLEMKAVIRKCISRGVGKVTLEGNTYFYGNKALGTLEQTIAYFSDPNNIRDRQIIQTAIQ